MFVFRRGVLFYFANSFRRVVFIYYGYYYVYENDVVRFGVFMNGVFDFVCCD